MEETWRLLKGYGETIALIFGLGVLWANLQRDRKVFMDEQGKLEKKIEGLREDFEQHAKSCPATIFTEIKAISSLVTKTASDVAYIRGQIDGFKKEHTYKHPEG